MITQYEVTWMNLNDRVKHSTTCIAEDGYSTPRDFPKMIAIQNSVPESMVRITSCNKIDED